MKVLQLTMFKGVKEDMMAVSHQIEIINKEIKMTEEKRTKGI